MKREKKDTGEKGRKKINRYVYKQKNRKISRQMGSKVKETEETSRVRGRKS